MERTHVGTIYRPGQGATEDAHGRPKPAWSQVATGVGANLQPSRGRVVQRPDGRKVEADWRGFLPPGTDVQEDDGWETTSGVGPTRYRVVRVGEQGGDWDIEVLLAKTDESFPTT